LYHSQSYAIVLMPALGMAAVKNYLPLK